MAKVIIFPDHQAFTESLKFTGLVGVGAEPLYPPQFCEGIVDPSVLVTSGLSTLLGQMQENGVPFSGVIPYRTFRGEVPDEGPPDPVWREIIGGIHIETAEQSLSDPQRIRVEAAVEKDATSLIPLMARIIRGGAFDPEGPVLAFEEEHRLVTLFPKAIGLSRLNDLLDLWIMMRTTVELFCEAWQRRSSLEPVREPRQGIGAIEIFRRLPGIDCQECGSPDCMEFATGLLLGRSRLEQCKPLFQKEYSSHLRSLTWLLKGMGVHDTSSTVSAD
jgi:ArsR family metal-binding transcriptional regulator